MCIYPSSLIVSISKRRSDPSSGPFTTWASMYTCWAWLKFSVILPCPRHIKALPSAVSTFRHQCAFAHQCLQTDRINQGRTLLCISRPIIGTFLFFIWKGRRLALTSVSRSRFPGTIMRYARPVTPKTLYLRQDLRAGWPSSLSSLACNPAMLGVWDQNTQNKSYHPFVR